MQANLLRFVSWTEAAFAMQAHLAELFAYQQEQLHR